MSFAVNGGGRVAVARDARSTSAERFGSSVPGVSSRSTAPPGAGPASRPGAGAAQGSVSRTRVYRLLEEYGGPTITSQEGLPQEIRDLMDL